MPLSAWGWPKHGAMLLYVNNILWCLYTGLHSCSVRMTTDKGMESYIFHKQITVHLQNKWQHNHILHNTITDKKTHILKEKTLDHFVFLNATLHFLFVMLLHFSVLKCCVFFVTGSSCKLLINLNIYNDREFKGSYRLLTGATLW